MKCPQCGKEIASDSQFCEYCGACVNSTIIPKIDIKWGILPMFLLLYLAFFITSSFPTFTPLYLIDRVLLMTILIVILLIIVLCVSIRYCIKKKSSKSFAIYIELLIIGFTLIAYGFWQPSQDEYIISFYSSEGGHYVSISDNIILDQSKFYPSEEIDTSADYLRRTYGLDGSYITTCNININDEFTGTGLILLLLSSIVYLLYAFIAHKKGWKF